MITDEEVQRQIRERAKMLLTPSNEQDKPIEHGMDDIDTSGIYQVYEITYENSVFVGKQIIAAQMTRQQAGDAVRVYRNALTGNEVIEKGYGFERMGDEK